MRAGRGYRRIVRIPLSVCYHIDVSANGVREGGAPTLGFSGVRSPKKERVRPLLRILIYPMR